MLLLVRVSSEIETGSSNGHSDPAGQFGNVRSQLTDGHAFRMGFPVEFIIGNTSEHLASDRCFIFQFGHKNFSVVHIVFGFVEQRKDGALSTLWQCKNDEQKIFLKKVDGVLKGLCERRYSDKYSTVNKQGVATECAYSMRNLCGI